MQDANAKPDTTEIQPRKGAVLSFDGGSLHIHLSGPGAEAGSGYFVFDENDVRWMSHDEREGSYLEVKVPRSEMVALRDWLAKWLEEVATP